MYQTIKGVYFNGQSSKPNSVRIELRYDSIFFEDETDFPLTKEIEIPVKDLENIDFSSSGELQLKFGTFPYQTLMIEDAQSIALFKEKYPQAIPPSIYSRVLQGSVLKVIGFSLISLVSVVFVYVNFIGPFIAEKAVNLVPRVAEIKLGEKMSEPLFATLEIDSVKSEQLTAFFETAGFKSDYPIELHVVDEPVVNAFAVPGGKIVIYQGILDAFETWEELAAVLGHELAHVEKRHSLKQMSRELSTYLVFSILTSDASGVAAVLVENAFMIKNMSNSRSMETEADEVGFEYLQALNINPDGMVKLFEALQKEHPDLDGNMQKVLEVLSTHPLTQDRIDNMQRLIDDLSMTAYPARPELKAYFEQLQSEKVEDSEEVESNSDVLEEMESE